MSFVVAHMQKMKANNLIGIGNHNQRKTENHSNEDIDVSRSNLNYDLLEGRTKNFKTDIQDFVNENKATNRATRKDAVLLNEWIISSDKGFFDTLDSKQTKDFFESAKDYFAEKFGDENIRYGIVHLDESTPHMHLGVVPFDDQQKLSAKRVFNRQALQEIQEELPEFLYERGFELERGQSNPERKNLSVPEYKTMKDNLRSMEKDQQQTKQELDTFKKELDTFRPSRETKIPKKDAFLHKDYSVVKNTDLEELERAATLSKGYRNEVNELKSERRTQQEKQYEATSKVHDLDLENRKLKKENQRLQTLVHSMQSLVRQVDELMERKFGKHLPDKWLERAGLKEVSEKTPERSHKPIKERTDEMTGPSR